ncbi:MAG: Flp family type IVb pilin [Chloroflexota bacterium]|nr:Flp family type IVb pilin [Chloroflexota bacterium]
MLYLINWLRMRLPLEREEGQSLAEYALILALIAVVVIGILATLGDTISSVFEEVVSALGGTP